MEKRMSFLEHLEELRKRIIFILGVFLVAVIISFSFSSFVLKILRYPLGNLVDKLVYFSPVDTIFIYMRIAFLSGFFLSLPFILYQLWEFIAPAIDKETRRYVGYFIIFSFLMFLVGSLFAYFIMLPYILRFLLGLGKEVLQPLLSASNYISFVSNIIFLSGVIFQMPVLVIILTKIGIINYQFLRRKRKWIILFIFIFSAVITPTTDIINMLIFAIPLIILYEISIWLSFILR